MARVVGIVERCVPKRHHRVAHVFVDGAAAGEDAVGHLGEVAVDDMRQTRGVFLEVLGYLRETADVREQDRHRLDLATELQLVGVPGELLDEHRRQVM